MQPIPKPEYPRPDRARAQWYNLNGEWAFALFPAGSEAAEAAFAKNRADYPRTITVPFTWTCPLSGVEEDVAGVGWYRRTARFDARGQRVFLCFGAVDYTCDVYVNGLHVDAHVGGYNEFSLDVTDAWQAGENTVEVRAEDYRAKSQTYGKQGYGEIQGIWQTVWLEARPETHLMHVYFDTKCSGEVTLHALVSCAAEGEVVLEAAFAGATHSARIVCMQGVQEVALPFAVAQPRLWSPEDPHLYEGEVALKSGVGEDRIGTYFGVREIGYKAFGGRETPWITLNGKPVYLNGTLDQAFHPQGYFTYPSDAAIRDEAWRLKRLGLNMVRIHIKPEEPRKLYWMDKLGVLVMQDMPCFWGKPDDTARAAYEREWVEAIWRDRGHPAIFAWVMFNETWGLKTDGVYTQKTQAWVRDVYRRAKAMDATRLVEDNSPCLYDHVETDLNTWHFYINGYELVRDHIRNVVAQAHAGSAFNCVAGETQRAVPLMNSECGLVWGVDGSAGDSDLAWQYHYMLNEYRLHDKLCGFVFTEFHDVVNEFNGYYRIDDKDKDFGYADFCRGMTLRDLHAADFVAIDAPPCQTLAAGTQATLPLVLSSFSDAYHGRALSLRWELWHDGLDGRVQDDAGTVAVALSAYGASQLAPLTITMPHERALAVLSLYLMAGDTVISRNFTTFDVCAPLANNMVEIPVTSGRAEGFALAWTAQGGRKACFGGSGKVSFEACLDALPEQINGLTLFLEAGAKRVLSKDCEQQGAAQQDADFMLGYRVDRGQFPNSYFMTDEEPFASSVAVIVSGARVVSLPLMGDFADARGVLSWLAQPDPRRLDEAGSYGTLHRVEIPSRLIPAIRAAGVCQITLEVAGDGGLALYGSESGRYATGMVLRAW